jgi:FAD/FMN-containing dehydrogenase
LERLLEAAIQSGCVTDAIVAESVAQARQLWHVRESIPLAQAQEGLNIKHDISIAVSRIPSFVAEVDAALAQAFPGVRLVNYGHLGDGNLHYNVFPPKGEKPIVYKALVDPVQDLVHAMVVARGGSFSAEHGIGRLKVADLERYGDPAKLAAMRAIKRALDPLGIMNPGAVLR